MNGHLSPRTATAIWLLYTANGALTFSAAWRTAWPLPLEMAIAVSVGSALAFSGALLFIGGSVAFQSLRGMSGMDMTKRVSDGAYRWSRNPQMVGWGLILIGVAVLGRSALALLWAAFCWASFRIYLPVEEQFLRSVFGEAYERYRTATHRYLGWPGGSP